MQSTVSANIQQAAKAAGEVSRREQEALRIFRPLPHSLPIFETAASEVIIRGGNQSSKTTSAAAMIASAACRIPITSPDGTRKLPFRFPKKRLLIWVTGYDENHIGSTLHHKLFERGAFDTIRDLETNKMRAYRPWEPSDLARASEKEPSPPFIPPRFLEGGVPKYKDKGKNVFSVARLKNGTEIWAFPSGGHCPMGRAVDIIWIDEDIQIPAHVQEWRIRQGQVSGRFIWSAWPHSKNEALMNMSRRAEEQKHLAEPDIVEYVLRYSDNPHIPEKERVRILDGMTSDERRSRDLGEYLTDLQLVFPNFDIDTHGLPRRDGVTTPLDIFLEGNDYDIPDDWTRYLIVDPGTVNQAAPFIAIPPPHMGDYVIQFDEVHLKASDATQFAREIKRKMGPWQFEAHIMDSRAGRQKPMGTGMKIYEIYEEAFKAAGIVSHTTRSGFLPGSDDVPARNMLVRGWLAKRLDGGTKYRIMSSKTPETQREFGLYKRRITREEIKEEVKSQDDHMMDGLGYFAASGLGHVHRSAAVKQTGVLAAIQRYRARESRRDGGGKIHLGAGTAEAARQAAL